MTDVERLLAQLRSADWREARAAAEALANVPGAHVTAALALALDAHNTAITEAAVAALVQRDEDAAAPLMWQVMLEMDDRTYDDTWFFLQR